MSDELREVLVFRDGKGNVYVVPCEALEPFRVPKPRQVEIEQSIAGVDVVGFYYPTSPAPPDRPGPAEPFYGLQLLGQWSLPGTSIP